MHFIKQHIYMYCVTLSPMSVIWWRSSKVSDSFYLYFCFLWLLSLAGKNGCVFLWLGGDLPKEGNVMTARQHLSPLRRLKRFGMTPQILKKFYSCTIESILTCCIIAWYGNCLASDFKPLQRVGCTTQYITGAKLPAIQDLYNRHCQRKV